MCPRQYKLPAWSRAKCRHVCLAKSIASALTANLRMTTHKITLGKTELLRTIIIRH